jgi:hypothetical protein
MTFDFLNTQYVYDCIDAIIFHMDIVRDPDEEMDVKEVSFEALIKINRTLPKEIRDDKLYRGKITIEECINNENYECGEYELEIVEDE